MRSRSFREGSVGLFVILGIGLVTGVILWLRGVEIGNSSYEIVIEFPNASGLMEGASVRYRGIIIGKIVSIKPSLNSVDVRVKVNSTQWVIPKNIQIETNRYGLIGEASVDITPLENLPDTMTSSMNPQASDCNKEVIICNGERLEGSAGRELIPTMLKLTDLYSSPKFYENLTAAMANTSQAAQKIAKLSEELSVLSKTINQDLKNFTRAADSVTQLAQQSSVSVDKITQDFANVSGQIDETSKEFQITANKVSSLSDSANLLITNNQQQVTGTIQNINQTATQLGDLAKELQTTVVRVNNAMAASDTTATLKNIEEVSVNLKEISEALNQPANIVTLQQTLDSARSTFVNTQKITSELDELIGDPQFRDNLRKLVNGLSTLVSTNEDFELQFPTAQQETIPTAKVP